MPDSHTKAPTGGCSGFLKRFWYYLRYLLIGFKWGLVEFFTRHRKLNIQKIPRRQGDVALITGGARGIGVEVIKKLLILDMNVIMGCRNEQAGKDVVDNIRQQGIVTGSAQILSLDLTSLDSVREFAAKVLKKYKRVNILINNAGIMLAPYQITKDNLESHFQVNYLSHFLLTQLLLPKLKSSGTPAKPSRIVNVSSVAAYGGKINFEDLQMSQLYSPAMAYMTTKMMQIVFTKDLESRLKLEEANVHVYAVHPGVVKTDLYQYICLARACGCCTSIIFKSPKQGSDCVAFAAVSPKVLDKGGSFFANCKKESPPAQVKNIEVQKKLWSISCELAGITKSTPKLETIFSVENEKGFDDENRGEAQTSSREGDSFSSKESSHPYETKSTDIGSLDEVEVDNQIQINQDIAKNIIDTLDDDTEVALKAISKEIVDQVVGRSEEIVNESVNTQPDFIPHEEEYVQENSNEAENFAHQSQENEVETKNSNEPENVAHQSQENEMGTKNSNESENVALQNQENELDTKNSNEGVSAEEVQLETKASAEQPTISDSDNSENSTKQYGAVTITEIFESNNDPEENNAQRMPTPHITVTNPSVTESDSDLEDNVHTLHKSTANTSTKVTIVEAS